MPKFYDKTKVPEADADGKIDYKDAAVKVGAAKLDKNGNLLFPNFYDICDASELTRLGFEQYMRNKKISDMLVSGAIQIVPFSDKILYDDNDGDGIPNKDDPYPDELFDDRFEIVNDFSYEPSIDFIDRHYKNSQECYNSKKDVLGLNTKGLSIATLFFEDSSVFANTASFFLNQAEYDFGLYPEREKDSSALNHAFKAMRHYLMGSGKEVNYSELDTCELISSSTQNLMHLLDNINRTMRCAEGALKNGNTVIICPKSDQKLKAVCLIKNKAESDTKDSDDIVNCEIINGKETGLKSLRTYYCNHVHRDWNLTVGEAIGTIVAKVERNGDKFTMYYKYYFKDIYEWAYHYELDPSLTSTSLHYLHETGTAKEYLMQGYFEGSLTWNLNDKVVDSNVVQQIFMTLADKEGGLENNIWKKSNEIYRIKNILDLE